MTIEGEIVFTRDKSTGRIHKRVWLGEGPVPLGAALSTFEGDNLDEAGLFDVLVTLADSDPADLCQRCFPDIDRGPVP